jgi:hypothetical protein
MCDADPLSAYILPRRERKIKALGGESCLAGREFGESVPPTAKTRGISEIFCNFPTK